MEKTPLQQVKQMLEDDVTPKAILSWIESTGEAAERDAIVEAYDTAQREVVELVVNELGIVTDDMPETKEDAEQYYETMYGSSFK